MRIKKLPQKFFLDSFKLVPRVAVNLILENNNGEILLTKRIEKPEVGKWHFPGSFLLKGETILNCAKRVAKDELDLDINPNKLVYLGVFEDIKDDPRGHVIDIVYKYSKNLAIDYQNELRKLFKKLPSEIGFNHKEVLNKLGYK